MSVLRRYICAASQILMGKISGYSLIEGCLVSNILRTNEEADQFNRAIQQALVLLRESSPLRYNRAVRYLSRIHNGADHHIASFNWPSRICTIDFPRLVKEYSDVPETLTAILVHESVHGLIWARGIKTTKSNVRAVEALCERQEVCFWNWINGRKRRQPANDRSFRSAPFLQRKDQH